MRTWKTPQCICTCRSAICTLRPTHSIRSRYAATANPRNHLGTRRVTRPPFEVADIIRRAGSKFIDRYRGSLTWAQLKVLRAIERCRTAALGGHRDRCLDCGHQTAISYNSCRNRHCPKCQTNAREKWLANRQRELLPVCYFHIGFFVLPALLPLVLQNKKMLCD